MDTKLKNNHKFRTRLSVLGVFVITIVTMCFFPAIHQQAQVNLAKNQQEIEVEQTIDEDLLRELYYGCYVLYTEVAAHQGITSASELYLEVENTGANEEKTNQKTELVGRVNNAISAYSNDFEGYRSEIDYCILLEDGVCEKNTSQPLDELFSGRIGKETEDLLIRNYSAYFRLSFDENGILMVEPLYNGNVDADELIKRIGQFDRESDIWYGLEEEFNSYGLECHINEITNFQVIFAIPRDSVYQLVQEDYQDGTDYWTEIRAYSEAGGQILYVVALIVLTGLAFVMTSNKIWKGEIDYNRPGKWYLLETAWIAAFSVLCLVDSFVGMIASGDRIIGYNNFWNQLMSGEAIAAIVNVLEVFWVIFCIYAIWYLAVLFIRPMFALGIKEYIKQYSLCYQLIPFFKSVWKRLVDETKHIDFSENSVRTIVKLVVVNFLVLSLCSMMWFYGILFLIIYSLVLFFLIERYYNEARENYQALRKGVARIAEGDLDTEIVQDIGMFEPIKEELGKVRVGFKKAVEEEVKSQRMKTELITNVSHDLKTPLTAITTYVELLKKEDITEEERRSYIETLERKSLRLKVLIEDLFEVSKATSNNITLDYMDVDVVKLLKQVSVEHSDKFEQMGLDLRWNVPEEKVILRLDNQKTYRVFENLFVNIQKYAMPNSRVYIDVTSKDGQAEIVLKNMSATELNVSAEEITERFVRGDSSRNTEGSGLGLAIAKSFTEAQNGNFRVEVDGDLFKVVIMWKTVKN